MDKEVGNYRMHAGWPVRVSVAQQYDREPIGYLPEIHLEGRTGSIIRVFKEPSGDLVYARRVYQGNFRPKVFEPGSYRVEYGEIGEMNVLTSQFPKSKNTYDY